MDRPGIRFHEQRVVTLSDVATPDNNTAGSDFGANSWLVEEMYEQFVADPG